MGGGGVGRRRERQTSLFCLLHPQSEARNLSSPAGSPCGVRSGRPAGLSVERERSLVAMLSHAYRLTPPTHVTGAPSVVLPVDTALRHLGPSHSLRLSECISCHVKHLSFSSLFPSCDLPGATRGSSCQHFAWCTRWDVCPAGAGSGWRLKFPEPACSPEMSLSPPAPYFAPDAFPVSTLEPYAHCLRVRQNSWTALACSLA